MTVILRSVSQPDWEIPLESGQYTAGRSESNHIVLPDASVSRHHSTLFVDGDVLTVADQGSSNGTFVNGMRIQQPVQLRPGDILKIGGYAFTCMRWGEAVTVPDAMPSTLIDQPGGAMPSPAYMMPEHATPPPPPPEPLPQSRRRQNPLPLVLGIGALALIALAGAVIIILLLTGRNKGDLSKQEEAMFIADSIVEREYPDYVGVDPSIEEWKVLGGDGYMVSYSIEVNESAGVIFPRALNIYVNPETDEVMIEEIN